MENIVENLNKKFNNKYNYLKLLNVLYDRMAHLATITFLYPCTMDEVPAEDKEEVEQYIQEFLSLHADIKVKFRKSFLDDKLVINEVEEFFKENKKGLLPYLNKDNINATHEALDVKVLLTLNQDILSLLDEAEFKSELKEFLDNRFIATFQIEIKENEEKLPDEIEADDILPSLPKTRRYKVGIEKEIIGTGISPNPEYIEDMNKPKESVILSGFMTKLNQKKYIAKNGKFKGKERVLYTFTLRDSSGAIECTYFCGKAHEKDIEALEDMCMLVCVGDVKEGFSGKLGYTIRKLALAQPDQDEQEDEQKLTPSHKHKQVVFPSIMQRSNQGQLFETKPSYNALIMNNDIVVFDIETTGLDPENDEITELGAVKIEHGEVTEKFSSFVKPNVRIPKEVENLTGISNEMVEFAPKVEDVIEDFYNWAKGCILSGHNIAGFDMKFVRKAGLKVGLKFDNQIVDTLIVARQSALRVPNYKLGTLVKALGLVLVDAHRAFNDAYATAQVLMALNREKK